MNRIRFGVKQLAGVVLILAGALTLAGQAKPTNLFKEIQDRKAKIVWSNAPATLIPADVCNILGCVPSGDKFIKAPTSTEGGKQIARALILSHDAKKGDLVIMRHDEPTDFYFFSVGPDGAVQKAAYFQKGSAKGWLPMGVAISKSISDKDKQVWLDRLEKISTSNAAPAAPQG